MKIVHLCLGAFFPDGYSYQENMLPKFHKMLGYDVEVIASLETFDENGKTSYYAEAKQYLNENNVLVHRLEYKKPVRIYRKLKRFKGLYEALNEANPNIVFIHNVQFLDINNVIRYLDKHREVKVYCDNHADFSNSATNWFSKNILHKIIWRRCAQRINPYTIKFYGVLPARVDFLVNMYGLPTEKCELLVMGADDDLVEKASQIDVKNRIRKKYGIKNDDFLIVTGGKIDAWKAQTLLLMDAVKSIKRDHVKLLVFGSVSQELISNVKSYCDGNRIQYIGWINANDSYSYFAAADLVVFPGRHSVFWEQVAAQGIPLICKDWPGTHHIDLGGNVKFLYEDSSETIKNTIEYLIDDPNEYLKMKKIAEEKGMKTFSYKMISQKCLQ